MAFETVDALPRSPIEQRIGFAGCGRAFIITWASPAAQRRSRWESASVGTTAGHGGYRLRPRRTGRIAPFERFAVKVGGLWISAPPRGRAPAPAGNARPRRVDPASICADAVCRSCRLLKARVRDPDGKGETDIACSAPAARQQAGRYPRIGSQCLIAIPARPHEVDGASVNGVASPACFDHLQPSVQEAERRLT